MQLPYKLREDCTSFVSELCQEWSPLWNIPGLYGCSDSKESAFNAGDLGLIPRWGRSPGEGNGYPLQYFCMEYPMDREAWQAIVYRVVKSWT